MSTTLSNRDKVLLLVLAGVLILFAVYMTVVKDYNAKRDAAEAQLAELTPQLQQLQEYEANQKNYAAKTTKMGNEIATQMQRFPNDIRSEHIILNAKTLQDALGIKIQSVGSEPAALLSSFQLPLKDESGQYAMQNVYAFTTGENIQCTMGYDQFKSLLDFIYSQNEYTALKSVSVTYDSETGGLSGTAAITKYFSISLRRFSSTLRARKNFLSLCPRVDPATVNQVVNDNPPEPDPPEAPLPVPCDPRNQAIKCQER